MTAPLLETRGLSRNFGALQVARQIDFRLEAGARHALIGPNGAGKSTFVNLLSGLLAPTAGRVLLKGADVTRIGEAGRVKRGIGLPIVDAAREREVERQMLDRGRALGLADVYVHPVARALIDLARAAQEAEEER